MKKMTRFAAIAAAMTLAACMAVPAMSFSASAAGTGSITITDESGITHDEVSAFQIFTADLDANNDLIVTGWGDGISVSGLSTAILADDDLKEIFVEKVGFNVERIKKRGKGMVFELKNSEGEAKVFDIEAMKTVAVNTNNCGWIDEYLRYRLDPEIGKLSVLDYDGLNERVLIEKGVLNGRLVAISGNNKYLYYFVKTEGGEKLIRERII